MPTKLCRYLFILAVTVAIAGPVHAQPEVPDDDDEVSLAKVPCKKWRRAKTYVNLKDEVELKDLIAWASRFSCKNFIYGANVGGRTAGKVNIVAPGQMSSGQAWNLFLVALQTMNLNVVPKGNVLEIVEAARTKEHAIPVYRPGRITSTDQIMRVIVRPSNMSVEDAAATFNALKSKDGVVHPFGNAGILILTDYGSHLKQMLRVMREIDQPVVTEQVYIIKIDNADAVEMAQKLTEIFGQPQSGKKSTPKPATRRRNRKNKKPASTPTPSAAEVNAAVPEKLIADERTNVLIVLANESAYLRVSSLVKYLDVAIEGGAGRIHVHYLENGDAEEMANVLNGVISGVQTPTGGNSRNNRRRPSTATASAGAGAAAFEGQVRVTADKATNALVVVASVKDFLSLRDVIRKLDTPRRQVFIEATIFEVSLDNSRRLGFSYHGGNLFEALDDDALLIGGVQHSSLKSTQPASLAATDGLIGGLIGDVIPGAGQLLGTDGISIPSFGVVFQALATSNDVNVLSAPHIIATNNEEAEISVGQNIPYQGGFSPGFNVGGQTGGAQGLGGLGFQSVQRADVALTLKITPHINESDKVRLEIDQEISDIASEDFNGMGPSWTKRKLKTTVVVDDQQSVVIGGLIQDKSLSTESKVPLLGDIPIFGHLFKFSRKTKTKTNLLIVITPYVIKDPTDAQRIYERKMRERREFLQTFTTFDTMEYKPDTDYRRKRGVIDEINRSVEKVERDRILLEEYQQKEIIYPSGPVEYDPNSEESDTSNDDSGDDDGDVIEMDVEEDGEGDQE